MSNPFHLRYTIVLGKGRYLKAAERACSRKARFETAAAAEAFVAGRYRAYRCPVCGGFHLTSGSGNAKPEPVEPPKPEPPGPKLGDLDWSAVLDPKPKPVPKEPYRPAPKPPPRVLRCAGSCGKDGRVLLVVEGRLVKSTPVDRALRPLLREGVSVEASHDDPPRVLRLA